MSFSFISHTHTDIVLRLLETPEQILILREIRPKVHAKDLAVFEELVAPKEMASLKALSTWERERERECVCVYVCVYVCVCVCVSVCECVCL